jgi:hypothetical protein
MRVGLSMTDTVLRTSCNTWDVDNPVVRDDGVLVGFMAAVNP